MHVTHPLLGKWGRLGNQLWQISSTVGIAYKNGLKPVFKQWDYQQYFNFPTDFFDEKIYGGIPSRDLALWMDVDRADLHDLRCFDGYENIISEYISPSDFAKKSIEDSVKRYDPYNATAVSVRRGDYQSYYGGKNLIEKQYYLDNWPSGRVLVFTDDPMWCSDNLPYADIIHECDWMDLHLMSLCKAHVISNSSFSWWGAFSSLDVTCPDPWMVEIPKMNIYRDHWKIVSR